MVVPNNHGFSLLKMIMTWGVSGIPPFKETPIYQLANHQLVSSPQSQQHEKVGGSNDPKGRKGATSMRWAMTRFSIGLPECSLKMVQDSLGNQWKRSLPSFEHTDKPRPFPVIHQAYHKTWQLRYLCPKRRRKSGMNSWRKCFDSLRSRGKIYTWSRWGNPPIGNIES